MWKCQFSQKTENNKKTKTNMSSSGSSGVYLRELFLAELVESMVDGLIPLILKLILPIFLIFFYHGTPKLFSKTFTTTRIAALFGLLVLFCGTTTPSGDIILKSNATNSNLGSSPTLNSDPVVQASSGWRGWENIREMKWINTKKDTFAPAAKQLIFVIFLLSMSSHLANLLGGNLLELFFGIKLRMTQCSGSYGGEKGKDFILNC